MFHCSHSRCIRSIAIGGFVAAGFLFALSSSGLAADDAKPAAGTAVAAPAAPSAQTAPAAPPPPVTPTITSVSCKKLKISVAWKGSGVNSVDYYSSGEPFLQARKDPEPTQTSLEIPLEKQWGGRKVEVRLFDKDGKLLDSKPAECKAAA